MTLQDRLIALVPKLALVLAILVGGAIAAKLLSRGASWLVRRVGLEAAAERIGLTPLLYGVGIRTGLAPLIERIAFYVGVMLTVLIAADAAGFTGVVEGLSAAVAYIPRLLVATVILAVGVRLAELVRTVVRQRGKRGDALHAPELVGRLAHHGVIALTVALAADQIGLETHLVNGLILVTAGAMALAAAAAFALAARPTLAHVVARYYTRRTFLPGDTITLPLDGVSRRCLVLRYGPTSVLVRAEPEGEEWVIPCRRLLDEPIRREVLIEEAKTDHVDD